MSYLVEQIYRTQYSCYANTIRLIRQDFFYGMFNCYSILMESSNNNILLDLILFGNLLISIIRNGYDTSAPMARSITL